MSYSTELDYLVSKIDERKVELQEFIASGRLPDFGAYQKLCGTLQGLDAVRELIVDLQKRQDGAEDDDNG